MPTTTQPPPFETVKTTGVDSKVQGYYIHKELFLGDEGQVCVSSYKTYVTNAYTGTHTHTCTHTGYYIHKGLFLGYEGQVCES